MQGKVEICGVNTSKLKVLKSDETRELLIKSHNGDKAAREELISGNLRLVLSVIQRFGNRGENPDDLFQVGRIGLMKAIDHFDVDQGVQFSTYGVPMIIGEVRRFLRDNNSVRVSRSLRDTAYKVLQGREKLMAETQREPTVEQIAKIFTGEITDWSEVGGDPGSYHYDITLKEYREITTRQVKVDIGNSSATVDKSDARVDNTVTPKTYTVKSGDCLWNIAKKFYGSGASYTKIYNANKGIIGGNPNLIYAGQVLTIP